MKKAYFFDMDGILFNSMPNHAQAWDDVMRKYGLNFTARDCYLQEGRTGQSVIDECFMKQFGRHALKEEWEPIYKEKTDRFHALGGAKPIPGVKDVLNYLRAQDALIYIVTGSGQESLFQMLDREFPGIFERERMVTALDVTHGKPDPEPYLKAFEKAQKLYAETAKHNTADRNAEAAQHCIQNPLPPTTYDLPLTKSDCVVIENAPLGTRAGRAAGLDVYTILTGPLEEDYFIKEDATRIFPDMASLLTFLQQK